MDGLVVVRRGQVLWVVGDIGRRLPLWAIANALKMEQGWPPCDADCEKNNKMIRNYVELRVRINK